MQHTRHDASNPIQLQFQVTAYGYLVASFGHGDACLATLDDFSWALGTGAGLNELAVAAKAAKNSTNPLQWSAPHGNKEPRCRADSSVWTAPSCTIKEFEVLLEILGSPHILSTSGAGVGEMIG